MPGGKRPSAPAMAVSYGLIWCVQLSSNEIVKQAQAFAKQFEQVFRVDIAGAKVPQALNAGCLLINHAGEALPMQLGYGQLGFMCLIHAGILRLLSAASQPFVRT